MAAPIASKASSYIPKYFDIGVNFTDAMFKGIYNGKPQHPSDLDDVIQRARLFNVDKFLVTGSSLQESIHSVEICKLYPGHLFSTVGVHPCTVTDFIAEGTPGGAEEMLRVLKDVAVKGAKEGVVKAFGEIGLDYDRLHYASKELQQEYFYKQLKVALEAQLPLFLHMRAACDDFVKIVKPFVDGEVAVEDGGEKRKLPCGVVHSFTGTEEELDKLLKLGFYIGINGCSLKTEENLKVAAKVPLEKLLIETDAPWCEIRKSHASYGLLSSYPNVFYPKVMKDSEPEQQDMAVSNDVVTNGEPNGQGKKQKQRQQQQPKKQEASKLHELLPFPLYKKEHYVKKYTPVETGQVGATITGQKTADQLLATPVIKSRNEPVYVGFVAEIMSKLKNVEPEVLVGQVYRNGLELFEIDG